MKKVFILLAFLLVSIPCRAEIIIVDPNGSADFDKIQDAINYSWDGDIIKVRPGTYYENINFYGKEITVTSTEPNNSDVIANTIIWGNNPAGTIRFETYEDSNSVLTGFTVQSTDNPGQGQGIGVYCYYSSPLISKNAIKNHYYGVWGEFASPTLVKNIVSSNVSTGIWDCDGQITMCTVSGNGSDGLKYCDGEVKNCDIYENGQDGIAVCNITINNCVIRDNTNHGIAGVGGDIINCTIVNNGQSGLGGCVGIIKHCIITSNNHYGLENCSGSIEYNNIWKNGYGSYGVGTIPSVSDIHTDPLFADVSNHDYHLKSEIGRWNPRSETWVIDDVSSPSIDAGDPCVPTNDEPYPNGDTINHGAYGGTWQASKSPNGQYTYCKEPIAGDLDENCKVDFNDVALMGSDWFEVRIPEPNVTQEWVARYNGPENSGDMALAIAVDNFGNVYVTGNSKGSGGTDADYATIKYEPNGNELWVARYDGTSHFNDYAKAIDVDDFGNVYVTGESYGFNTNQDYVTIKYDHSGTELWVARYNYEDEDGRDAAHAITVDNLGNVYVTGASRFGKHDYATIKYSSSGNEIWVARYNNSPFNSEDYAKAIALDKFHNVYITGTSDEDYVTVKYDPNGEELWVARYDGPSNSDDNAYDIAIDSFDNVYVTGESVGVSTSYDYATIKYEPNGNECWVVRYNGPSNGYDSSRVIRVDNLDNVYVTGKSYDSDTGDDYTTIKYEPNGAIVWIARYTSPGKNSDWTEALNVNEIGAVYVTGVSKIDYATVKYDPNGEELWVARYNGPSNGVDEASDMAIDNAGNVYVTGTSYYSTVAGDDYATIKYRPVNDCIPEITGDINNDCIINYLDLKTITDYWLECNLDPPEACWE